MNPPHKEKIHCAHDQQDGIILSGVTDLNNKPHYFSGIFGPEGTWTEIYALKPLDEEMFDLELENWRYWEYWLNRFLANQGVLHPVDYARLRTQENKESLSEKNIFPDREELEKAETYYQNRIRIDSFLKTQTDTLFAKADFFGDRDGFDTQAIWTIVHKTE